MGLNDSGKLVLSENVLERISVYLDDQRFLEGIGYIKDDILDP